MSGVRVGIFPPVGQHASGTGQRAATLTLIAESGIDHVCVEAGCSAFNVIACADDDQTAVVAVGELRWLLADAR